MSSSTKLKPISFLKKTLNGSKSTAEIIKENKQRVQEIRKSTNLLEEELVSDYY